MKDKQENIAQITLLENSLMDVSIILSAYANQTMFKEYVPILLERLIKVCIQGWRIIWDFISWIELKWFRPVNNDMGLICKSLFDLIQGGIITTGKFL